jgi:hypothetical protein
MTVSTPNGKMERRTLSSQLDRFDSMIDGLDGAIKEVIADSVKEAVRATLIEIATNPDVLSVLRGGMTAAAPVTTTTAADVVPAGAPPTTISGKIRQAIASAWTWTVNKLQAAGRFVATPFMIICRGGWQQPVFAALAAGAVVGAFHAATPWLIAAVGGLGAAGCMLFSRFVDWARRIVHEPIG